MGTTRRERLGILGGSFNPVHLGHLILAQVAMETHELDRVAFVPCARPPHKDPGALLPARHRTAMLEAALEDSLAFELCDLEIRRDGPSYSVDTAKELRRLHPGAELYLIVGADTLKELHTWRNVYELLALCRVVSFGRPGMEPGGPPPDSIRLDPPWPERLRRDLSPGRMIEISSSDIRHRVAEGMSIRYLVPRAVETYIAEHGLYTGADGDSEGRG